jgi:hypothetical protein
MNAEVKMPSTALAALRESQPTRVENLPSVTAGFGTLQSFELMQRAAKAIAASTLVPQQYQGNLANCMIALEMAQRIGASPLMVAQHLFVVNGRPSWSAVFLIASFNQCGKFSALRYEWVGNKGGEDYGCRAWAIEKSTGEKLIGSTVTMAIVKKEGWLTKSGSKWQTMPDQMFMYRAASFFVKAYAPEISMGLSTAEELHDTFEAESSGDGKFRVPSESLARAEFDAKESLIVDAQVATAETPA